MFVEALKIHVRALRTPLLLLSPAEYNALGLGADRPLPVDDRAGEAADALLCRHVPLQRREAFQVGHQPSLESSESRRIGRLSI